MKQVFFPAFILAVVASGAFAAPEVTKTYTNTEPDFAIKDELCVAAMLDKIAPEFDGLVNINLSSNSIFQTTNGYLATYTGAVFNGRYGDAEGTVSCVFTEDGSAVTDVAVTFEGQGLGGFKRHPLARLGNDLGELKTSSFSTTIIADR